MNEGTHLVLTDGRELLLKDDSDLLIALRGGGEYPVSCPPGGYGGGTLLLSPSERHLIFSFFSGESEEGVCLFRIEESRLVPLFESGYFYGEGAGYLFSDDETVLFQSLLGGFGPWYVEDAETDAEGVPYFRYGELNILDIPSGALSRHRFHVYPSERWVEETNKPSYLTKITGDTLHIAMPWGEERLTLPLADTVVFRPE